MEIFNSHGTGLSMASLFTHIVFIAQSLRRQKILKISKSATKRQPKYLKASFNSLYGEELEIIT